MRRESNRVSLPALQERAIMATNRVQFQPGLSLPAFLAQYGTEAACEHVLMQARWPEGFV